jgi:hypothetical protein
VLVLVQSIHFPITIVTVAMSAGLFLSLCYTSYDLVPYLKSCDIHHRHIRRISAACVLGTACYLDAAPSLILSFSVIGLLATFNMQHVSLSDMKCTRLPFLFGSDLGISSCFVVTCLMTVISNPSNEGWNVLHPSVHR